MRPSQFVDRQLLDVIQWSEPEAATLAYRYPTLDTEIQTGSRLAVRESEMALFVDQERGADIFGPGLHELNAETLPVLAGMNNWGKGFASPFKSDIYFFSMTDEFDQMWGTSAPIVLRDAAGEMVRARAYGSYSYRIADVRLFFAQVSGARESYLVYDLDDRLRRAIVARMTAIFSANGLEGYDLKRDGAERSYALVEQIKPAFAALGLELTRFCVRALSVENELHSSQDERMAISGDGSCEAPRICDGCSAAMRADHGVLKCDYCHVVVVGDAGEGAGALDKSEVRACPACEISLIQATVGGVSLLYCTRCDGMLVAMEEFDALVAAARALPSGGFPVAAVELRDTFDCPRCARAMGVSFYDGDVAIDSCEDCGLNWLDHGELARIAHAPVAEVRAAGAYFNAAKVDSSVGLNLGA